MDQDLIPHLFRTEFGKIVSMICKRYGLLQMQAAEDIASETFLAAAETWPYKGLPENPTAWLYTVAKNKTINFLKRQQLYYQKISPAISEATETLSETTFIGDQQEINDNLLQMFFAIANPELSPNLQSGLALRILCGFGIEEIANAFLSTKETIHKRLVRGREKLRNLNISLDWPSASEMPQRLDSVLQIIYLLFNEGYYSESDDRIIREELCLEAIRLGKLLLAHSACDTPKTNALLALMYFQASRLAARENEEGEIVLYADQDPAQWNPDYIALGSYHFHRSAKGEELHRYHLEASIAFWHTQKEESSEKWSAILAGYNRLLSFQYSPIAALNRCYALYKLYGVEKALAETQKLKLDQNVYYHVLLAELYLNQNSKIAAEHLRRAIALSCSEKEKRLFSERLARLSF